MNPENHFDFWLGEWDAVWGEDGKGTNHVERILEAKVVQETAERTEVVQEVGWTVKGDKLESFHRVKQTLRLGFESHLTQVMTGCVIGHFVRVHRADICNVEDVNQILGELKCAGGNIKREVML